MYAIEKSGIDPNSFNYFVNPIARSGFISARAEAVTTTKEGLSLVTGVALQVALEYVGRVNLLKNPDGLNINLLRESGGNVNGISVSLGKGYGAKPRFDIHPLGYPSRKTSRLTIPDFLKGKPLPHYHRGKGNNLKYHRPWEIGPDGKRRW